MDGGAKGGERADAESERGRGADTAAPQPIHIQQWPVAGASGDLFADV